MMGHLRLDSVITESYTQRDRKAEEEGSEGEAMSSTGLSRSDGAKQKMWFSAEGMKQRKFKEKKTKHMRIGRKCILDVCLSVK